LLVVVMLVALGQPAAGGSVAGSEGGSRAPLIVLPGATSAEGIAAGRGSTFYAGDLFGGDIYRGDIRRGTAERFIDVSDGRGAVGMSADVRHNLLFVAGGFAGTAFVYDTVSGRQVADYQFANPDDGPTVVNDVIVTGDGAWFTDSSRPHLYFVPIVRGKPASWFRTLELSGPAANTSSQFNLNGIEAAANGRVLIVAHSGNGELYTVDPQSGSSALIRGVSVPLVDGIVLDGRRLWAVQNSNQVTRIRLSGDLTRGTVEKVITNDLFQVPTTAALFGHTLAVVNAKFDTGFPPTAKQYEIVLVRG